MISVEQSLSILDKIKKTFISEQNGYEWDVKAFKASIEHLSKNSASISQNGKVGVVVRTDSNLSRCKSDGRFTDDAGSGTGEVALTIAKRIADDIPVLMLIRVNGKEEQGWMGSPFWWPVILTPKNMHTAIFASETLDNK